MAIDNSASALGASTDVVLDDEATTLHCYRHPDRETWVRCGRCDRPICTRCAMQGPVGFRCRDCGKPAFDPLTSFTPVQLLAGIGVAAGGGVVGGLVGAQMGGFFGLIVGFFVGGFVAEMVTRVVGYKRGPVMIAITMGGIAVGAAVGLAWALMPYVNLAGQQESFEFVLQTYATGAILYAGAAMAGAWTRIR